MLRGKVDRQPAILQSPHLDHWPCACAAHGARSCLRISRTPNFVHTPGSIVMPGDQWLHLIGGDVDTAAAVSPLELTICCTIWAGGGATLARAHVTVQVESLSLEAPKPSGARCPAGWTPEVARLAARSHGSFPRG
eukprot:CAMPEP_0174733472 /NCGR_PEP_ID=MMETSP1094-20130205/61388_1 /TAXON_ID=156173 /ORGANISM="Chrysochromulina brevifilum, Strain UTEX LB 985" /LENGTH=135 /DNA_ID=CAMNT_0015936131 /DNA_START=260 /DNA_END=667 /DNA_ORIENTATION=+